MKQIVPAIAVGLVLACWPAAALEDSPRATLGEPPVSVPATNLPGSASPAVLARSGIAETILDAALAWCDEAATNVDRLVPAAEAAAEHFIAGGDFYVAGNGGFQEEMEYRAGGFPFTRFYADKALGPDDVLAIGLFEPNEPLPHWERISGFAGGNGRYDKGMMVYFASCRWPAVAAMAPMINTNWWKGRLAILDTGAPAGGSPAEIAIGQMATVATAWAFQGEVIAAATRKGKTLATLSADAEPGSRNWDNSVRGAHVHPAIQVPSVAEGRLGRAYLGACRRQLALCRETQCGNVRRAAERVAAHLRAGRRVWVVVGGHCYARGVNAPRELAGLVLFGRDWLWLSTRPRISPGDLLLWFGYRSYPQDAVGSVTRAGGEAVVVCAQPVPEQEHVTQVKACWDDFDTAVDLPNYPIRILPSSGTVTTPIWYSLIAEVVALSRPRPASPAGE